MYVTEVQFIAEGLALLLGINVMSLNLLPFNCHVARIVVISWQEICCAVLQDLVHWMKLLSLVQHAAMNFLFHFWTLSMEKGIEYL